MRSFCTILSLVLALSFASTNRAEVSFSDANGSEEGVVRLTVTPAAAPSPTLRYRLLQRDLELKSGNAAPFYYRAQLDLEPLMKSLREKFKEESELDTWYAAGAGSTALEKLPLDKIREVNRLFDPIYTSNLATAFERSRCDWQLNVEELRGPEIFSVRLEEIQGGRQLNRLMSLRARLAIAERRYGDAVKTMRESYRLGRDLARIPFLVCGLVGIATNQMTNRTMLEMIASPESPNMYWALGQLPSPPIDLRPAVHFEMDFGPRMFPVIHDAESADHSPQEWGKLLAKTLRDLQAAGGPQIARGADNETVSGIAATGLALLGYTRAKERLIADGMDASRVEKMPVGQVVAIYTERTYHRLADDWENLWQVPFPQANELGKRLEKELDAARPFSGGANSEILPMVSMLLPAVRACRAAEVRLDRDTAALRAIEALRMYAAGHDGKLPAQLADIDDVPVPMNPATGKPFVYRLEGAKAILELPASDQLPNGNCRYEIEIAAKK